MIIQKLTLPLLLVLVADASALFYFLKDHKHQHSYEEVDHHNYDHKHHEHKPHEEHKHQNHKYQGHKHHEEKTEHKHREHKPQQMHKHHEYDHYHHHEDKPEHHEHKQMHKPQQMHKHHEYDHHYHHHEDKPEHKHHYHQQHHGYHQDHKHEHKHHDHHEHKHQGQPHYEFKYGVRDPNTGDIKNQWEMRKGDDVQGEYSLVEADGTIRTVQYTAGKHTGFNAVVKKEGKAQHPIGKVTLPVIRHPKPNIHSVKPVHQEQETFDAKAKGSRVYTDVDTSRLQYYNPSDLPTNHKPVFSGIDEETNLLALYKHYPVHNVYGNDKRGFDYGINEYLTKRSYDLSKITAALNASPTVDPIRAARGSFVMGR